MASSLYLSTSLYLLMELMLHMDLQMAPYDVRYHLKLLLAGVTLNLILKLTSKIFLSSFVFHLYLYLLY